MRKFYENVLREYFHKQLVRDRDRLEWSQARMASVLEMDERSFIDLDHGKNGCSGLTLALYLAYCCDDPLKFLEGFKDYYEAKTRVLA